MNPELRLLMLVHRGEVVSVHAGPARQELGRLMGCAGIHAAATLRLAVTDGLVALDTTRYTVVWHPYVLTAAGRAVLGV